MHVQVWHIFSSILSIFNLHLLCLYGSAEIKTGLGIHWGKLFCLWLWQLNGARHVYNPGLKNRNTVVWVFLHVLIWHVQWLSYSASFWLEKTSANSVDSVQFTNMPNLTNPPKFSNKITGTMHLPKIYPARILHYMMC